MKYTLRDLKRVHREYESKNKGEKNGNWVGDKVCYAALHTWVGRQFPKPKTCMLCGEDKKLEAANISGQYKRDLKDWEWLCRRCHMIKDGRMENFKKHRGKPERCPITGRFLPKQEATT